jgi:hypothetical protein
MQFLAVCETVNTLFRSCVSPGGKTGVGSGGDTHQPLTAAARTIGVSPPEAGRDHVQRKGWKRNNTSVRMRGNLGAGRHKVDTPTALPDDRDIGAADLCPAQTSPPARGVTTTGAPADPARDRLLAYDMSIRAYLEQMPLELNRRDSQALVNERVCPP